MIKKILLLLILVMPFVVAEGIDAQIKSLETDINITVLGYYVNNDSFSNLTIITEDNTFKLSNINNKTNFYQSYEIDMIRKMNCSETDIYNLTQTCVDYFGEFSGYNSLISTIADLNSSKIACISKRDELENKSEYYTQYTECSASLKVKVSRVAELEKNQKEEGNEKWFFGFGGMLIGAGLYHLYLESKKNKPHKSPMEREEGSYPTQPPSRDYQKDIDKYVERD